MCVLCNRLQGRFKDVEASLVRIYVWLRYSAVRQLTWQRNYNTQASGDVYARRRLYGTAAIAAAAAAQVIGQCCPAAPSSHLLLPVCAFPCAAAHPGFRPGAPHPCHHRCV